MRSSILYTPFDLSDAAPAGRRRFWKQVLPNTTITYKGQKVKFDKRYHMDLAQSFHKAAFDQVPIVFADAENRHTMDPRNFGGDVLDMQVRPNGLYALIEADKDAAKAIKKNPRLGVSARIRQGIEKADGRMFDKAIEHLCLTMNPRVTGMEPWQAVDLSDEDADIEVVDLTAATYEEGTEMGKLATKTKSKTASGKIDLSQLDDEQFQTLLDLSAAALADPEAEEDEEVDDDQDVVEDTSTIRRKPRRKKSRTKVTIDKESEDDGDEEDEDEGAEEDEADETDLSDTVIKREEVSQFQQMRIDLAEQRWDTEREAYERDGVPPFLLDLAEPVLSLPDAMTIDLSDEETLDATSTIRQMLDGVKGILDLTGELGTQIDLSGGDDEDDDTDKFLEAWDKQYG